MTGPRPSYVELAAATNFSFLRGASPPSDMVARALELGHAGIGIADRNTVAGVVRAHVALRDAFEKVLQEAKRTKKGKLKLKHVHSDEGKEFLNRHFRHMGGDGDPDAAKAKGRRKKRPSSRLWTKRGSIPSNKRFYRTILLSRIFY